MVVSHHRNCTGVVADEEMAHAGTKPLLSASPLASPYSRLILFYFVSFFFQESVFLPAAAAGVGFSTSTGNSAPH